MYTISEELKALADKVIEKNKGLAHLAECRILYLYCDKPKKRGNKNVFADTEKLSEKLRSVAPCDFIVTFYQPNCAPLAADKMEILMYHELKHVGFDPEGKFSIIPHDVEDFTDIIETHGMSWVI